VSGGADRWHAGEAAHRVRLLRADGADDRRLVDVCPRRSGTVGWQGFNGRRWRTSCPVSGRRHRGAETMRDVGAITSPEADPGRYESGETNPDEDLAGDPAEADNE
jgi:hypothetical protein